MFAKNDEEKRNRLWKTAISVSTLVIILIAVFFVIKLFTSNPLEGTWVREDSDLMLTISGEDQAVVQWPEEWSLSRNCSHEPARPETFPANGRTT